MLKKFPSGKMNGRKNARFFLSGAPTHHSFTFNLRFLYELQHNARLSKTVCGIFQIKMGGYLKNCKQIFNLQLR